MFSADDYQLLSAGNQTKVERFGGRIIQRPCPAAQHADTSFRDPDFDDFDDADFDAADETQNEHANVEMTFEGRTGKGRWLDTSLANDSTASDWNCSYQVESISKQIQFELAATPTGQVGLFPEHAANWDWIAKRCAARCDQGNPPRVLNLFAYTGGSTLVAAAAGAEVTHVDSAKSVVNWARRNAKRSGLEDAPIRWIVEDACKYVAREVKRGNKYDGIILDPPTYGHGPKREEWKLSRDLIDLLGNCKQLLSDLPMLFLLTCHTPGYGEAELGAALSTCLFGSCGAGVKTKRMDLLATNGQRLPAGCAAYWP